MKKAMSSVSSVVVSVGSGGKLVEPLEPTKLEEFRDFWIDARSGFNGGGLVEFFELEWPSVLESSSSMVRHWADETEV